MENTRWLEQIHLGLINGGVKNLGNFQFERGAFECNPEWRFDIEDSSADEVKIVSLEELTNSFGDIDCMKRDRGYIPLKRDFFDCVSPTFFQQYCDFFENKVFSGAITLTRFIFSLNLERKKFEQTKVRALTNVLLDFKSESEEQKFNLCTYLGKDFVFPSSFSRYTLKKKKNIAADNPAERLIAALFGRGESLLDEETEERVMEAHSRMKPRDYAQYLTDLVSNAYNGKGLS